MKLPSIRLFDEPSSTKIPLFVKRLMTRPRTVVFDAPRMLSVGTPAVPPFSSMSTTALSALANVFTLVPGCV